MLSGPDPWRVVAAELPDPLSAWLQRQLGQGLVGCSPVPGGCSHRAWRLDWADGRRLFAKTNGAASLAVLEAEAQGLRDLAAHAPAELVVPEPLALGLAGDQAVLVLPWYPLLPLGGSAAEGDGFRLGQALAALHRASAAGAPSQGFGAAADNFIGPAPQRNHWRADWADFFSACRLAPQLAWAERRGQPLRGAAALLERVPQWLAGRPNGPAVLVHGDLWSGNAARLADGRSVLFDPACYWGDREVDLAMAQLFGGFPPAFFDGYANHWPLEPGAAERVALYNLYHLLNHANLFGGSYGRQAQACIDALLSG